MHLERKQVRKKNGDIAQRPENLPAAAVLDMMVKKRELLCHGLGSPGAGLAFRWGGGYGGCATPVEARAIHTYSSQVAGGF
jgi:hypothetical protein